MRHISTPGDMVWSQQDRSEAMKAELERWRERATALSHNIEMACDALRKGEEVTLTDSRGAVVVVKKEPQRCAECNCEHGGGDCNWIKPGPLSTDSSKEAGDAG